MAEYDKLISRAETWARAESIGAQVRLSSSVYTEIADALTELQEQVEELQELIDWSFNTLGEINPSNYDHEDACELNAKSVEVILGLKPRVSESVFSMEQSNG